MNRQITNQEILLFTRTSFAKRELCERDNSNNNEVINSADQMEKACWSGLVFEMLPGIFNRNDKKNMYVWQVNQAGEFIHVASGSAPRCPDYVTSINPYFFHPGKVYN